jgi:uncharacterized glyoxalase superfamily protein PhnB
MTMKLQDIFLRACFGSCKDKFGVQLTFKCPQNIIKNSKIKKWEKKLKLK